MNEFSYSCYLNWPFERMIVSRTTLHNSNPMSIIAAMFLVSDSSWLAELMEVILNQLLNRLHSNIESFCRISSNFCYVKCISNLLRIAYNKILARSNLFQINVQYRYMWICWSKYANWKWLQFKYFLRIDCHIICKVSFSNNLGRISCQYSEQINIAKYY